MPNHKAGSSPLSRGIPIDINYCYNIARIIPALAGNTVWTLLNTFDFRDHPRSRGEYADCIYPYPYYPGSSPLSRGIHPNFAVRHGERRIIPALAGNTFCCPLMQSIWKDHPRSRGEYVRRSCALSAAKGSSPLSRGILADEASGQDGQGIIPALAGNTDCTRTGCGGCWDHPRSRGEYAIANALARCSWGSSPLSRGIQLRQKNRICSRGIIPALAGNTRGKE